jgi:hypothetical protein
MKKTHKLIFSTLALGLQSSMVFAVVDCSQPSQRDATCVGSINTFGTVSNNASQNNSSLDGNGLPAGTQRPRASNAIQSSAVSVPNSQKPNSCLAVPLTTYVWDPVSYGTTWPKFTVAAGYGYLGSGAASSPLDNCSSPTDPGANWAGGPGAACTTWVPDSHPYLFTGGGSFTQCNGTKSNGSIACSTTGKNAYVSSNSGTLYDFRAYMIACESNSIPPSANLFGAPFSSWRNCSESASCNFFVYYPKQSGVGGY